MNRTVRWFGGPWPRPLEEHERAPTPVGEECVSCRCTILDGDLGVMIPTFSEGDVPFHRHCILRELGVDPGSES